MLAAGSVLIGDSEAFNGVMVRMGTPEEIAYGVVFLTSDESSYMTGTELIIDGGKFDLTGDCTRLFAIFPEVRQTVHRNRASTASCLVEIVPVECVLARVAKPRHVHAQLHQDISGSWMALVNQ